MAKASYTEEQKASVLTEVEKVGVYAAAKAASIPRQTVSKWAKEAGVQGPASTKKKVGAVAEDVKKKAPAAKRKVETVAVDVVEKVAADVKKKAPAAKKKVETVAADVKKKAPAAKEKVKTVAADVKKKTPSTRKKAAEGAAKLIIQSPMGGEITPEEIAAKVPAGAVKVYVRVDENKLYWVSKEDNGFVDIW